MPLWILYCSNASVVAFKGQSEIYIFLSLHIPQNILAVSVVAFRWSESLESSATESGQIIYSMHAKQWCARLYAETPLKQQHLASSTKEGDGHNFVS